MTKKRRKAKTSKTSLNKKTAFIKKNVRNGTGGPKKNNGKKKGKSRGQQKKNKQDAGQNAGNTEHGVPGKKKTANSKQVFDHGDPTWYEEQAKKKDHRYLH